MGCLKSLCVSEGVMEQSINLLVSAIQTRARQLIKDPSNQAGEYAFALGYLVGVLQQALPDLPEDQQRTLDTVFRERARKLQAMQ